MKYVLYLKHYDEENNKKQIAHAETKQDIEFALKSAMFLYNKRKSSFEIIEKQ